MKVLFVNTNDTSGGAARAAVRIMQGVEQQGVQTQLFVKDKYSSNNNTISLRLFVPSNKLYRALDWVAAKVKNQWQHLLWRPYRNTKENVFMSDMRSTRLHGVLQKLDYDILHLHWINQRFMDLRELKKVNKPIVWTLHDSWPFCGVCHYFLDCTYYQSHCGDCPMLHSNKEKDLAYRVFEKKKRAYKGLNLHIVTPSRWLGECVKRSALLGQFPITVIPNCLDTDVYRPLTEQEINDHLEVAIKQNPALCEVKYMVGDKVANPIILYGAMNAATDRIKGFASLLSALQILDNQGFKANLVVFGASESELRMEFEHISVSFIGYIVDTGTLVTLYNMADVMVVPSLTEVFGQTASEALACGTPVVCFKTTGIQEVVDHMINGYQAIFEDCVDLATGIRWCLANNHNRALSNAAREKVMMGYTIDNISDKYTKLYQTIIK